MTSSKKMILKQLNSPVKCGKRTFIDKTASFIGNVEIGDGCYIGAYTIIGQPSNYEIERAQKKSKKITARSNKTTLGNNVLIQPNVIISGNVKIGNNICIDPFTTIGGHTRIGDDTKIVYRSQIYENVKIDS